MQDGLLFFVTSRFVYQTSFISFKQKIFYNICIQSCAKTSHQKEVFVIVEKYINAFNRSKNLIEQRFIKVFLDLNT